MPHQHQPAYTDRLLGRRKPCLEPEKIQSLVLTLRVNSSAVMIDEQSMARGVFY